MSLSLGNLETKSLNLCNGPSFKLLFSLFGLLVSMFEATANRNFKTKTIEIKHKHFPFSIKNRKKL